MIFVFLAQGVLDPSVIPTASGWSAFGLVGMLLYWLCFYHLPNKDKQLKDVIDENNVRADRQVTDHNNRSDKRVEEFSALVKLAMISEEKQRTDFKQSLDKVITHCQGENQKSREDWSSQLDVKMNRYFKELGS